MKEEITEHVKNCKSCQEKKLVRVKTRQPMVITDTPCEAFEKISLDIVGPLPITENGNRYILTVQDLLTKYSQAIPLHNATAKLIAEAFSRNFICRFGCPKSILTDQGKNFVGEVMRSFTKIFQIKQFRTSAFHPQSNGSLERSHHTLIEYLKHYIKNFQDWDSWLDFATFSYNTGVHEATGYTPHELVYGRRARVPSTFSHDHIPYTYHTYLDHLLTQLHVVQSSAAENLKKAKEKSKRLYDRKVNAQNFDAGDDVYLLNNVKTHKFMDEYTGPYKITKLLDNCNAEIQMSPNKTKIVHLNRLKHAFVKLS